MIFCRGGHFNVHLDFFSPLEGGKLDREAADFAFDFPLQHQSRPRSAQSGFLIIIRIGISACPRLLRVHPDIVWKIPPAHRVEKLHRPESVGAENLRNPMACPEIIEQLPAVMDQLGIDRLSDIIGIIE